MEVLKIKKLHPDAHVPTRAHDTDAGMDLYALPVEYTDEEKKAYKSVIDQNVTYAKFFDLLAALAFLATRFLVKSKKPQSTLLAN